MKTFAFLLLRITLVVIALLYLNKQYALTGYKISLFSTPSGEVRIDFVNKSAEEIKAITLSPSSEKIENLHVGERRTATFEQAGEGTYQFTVDFASGKQLKESERYVESGYFLTEEIYIDKVKTSY
ncbi:MAG: hypothetical protein PHQ74_09700 [Crocinitomicaceae bacterium]|nr:hypothetical protein [Crocinitomicaceae bacterium]